MKLNRPTHLGSPALQAAIDRLDDPARVRATAMVAQIAQLRDCESREADRLDEMQRTVDSLSRQLAIARLTAGSGLADLEASCERTREEAERFERRLVATRSLLLDREDQLMRQLALRDADSRRSA